MRQKRKREQFIRFLSVQIVLCILLLLGGCAISDQERTVLLDGTETVTEESHSVQDTTTKQVSGDAKTVSDIEADEVYVHVCGAVNAPGVYALKPDNRIIDAVNAAGGFANTADEEALNQAEHVSDGQRLYVPHIGEETTKTPLSEESSLVNINQASKEELQTLTGIGEAKAQSIIEYREKNGAFRAVEELMNIEGIKEGVYNKVKDYITVG